ncbi:carbohydrate kinase family protein [Piscicoccus intestinalis]|uniref:carbohydrate kinase family protein n=1 Tax=Piscicoccus intestinalis TaxID=746033 RepID=UPI0008382659|nr:carbohydrate kinase [Piscicoccus intestinalis]
MHEPVIVAGEALIDIVVSREGENEHVGGSPANVAIGLARLTHEAALACHIGTDERGVRIKDHLAGENVSLVDGSTSAERTPTATALLDTEGAATYAFKITWDLDRDLPVPPGAHFHTGSIAATLQPGGDAVRDVMTRVRDTNTISYDPNARPQLMGHSELVRPRVEELVALSDVVKASDEDIDWMYDGQDLTEVLRHWADLGATVVVATRGGEGALVYVQGEFQQVGLPAVQVVDTVGAGDSFMSGILSGLLDAGLLGGAAARERLRAADWSQIEPAVTRALSCAAITVARAGANPPRRDELAG